MWTQCCTQRDGWCTGLLSQTDPTYFVSLGSRERPESKHFVSTYVILHVCEITRKCLQSEGYCWLIHCFPVLIILILFKTFFGQACSMWKLLGQGLNLHHSSSLSHISDNTRSLMCWVLRELCDSVIVLFLKPHLQHMEVHKPVSSWQSLGESYPVLQWIY